MIDNILNEMGITGSNSSGDISINKTYPLASGQTVIKGDILELNADGQLVKVSKRSRVNYKKSDTNLVVASQSVLNSEYRPLVATLETKNDGLAVHVAEILKDGTYKIVYTTTGINMSWNSYSYDIYHANIIRMDRDNEPNTTRFVIFFSSNSENTASFGVYTLYLTDIDGYDIDIETNYVDKDFYSGHFSAHPQYDFYDRYYIDSTYTFQTTQNAARCLVERYHSPSTGSNEYYQRGVKIDIGNLESPNISHYYDTFGIPTENEPSSSPGTPSGWGNGNFPRYTSAPYSSNYFFFLRDSNGSGDYFICASDPEAENVLNDTLIAEKVTVNGELTDIPVLVRIKNTTQYVALFIRDKGDSFNIDNRYDMYGVPIWGSSTYSFTVGEEVLIEENVSYVRSEANIGEIINTTPDGKIGIIARGYLDGDYFYKYVTAKVEVGASNNTVSKQHTLEFKYEGAPISVNRVIPSNNFKDLACIGNTNIFIGDIRGESEKITMYIENYEKLESTDSDTVKCISLADSTGELNEELATKVLIEDTEIKGVFSGLNINSHYKISDNGSIVETEYGEGDFLAISENSVRVIKEVI